MKKIDIVYEDKAILVVNKPAHLLTIATEKQREHTLYHQVYEYIKKVNPKQKIFIVHRLDKDTSGLVVFAKSEQIKVKLQHNWDKFTREYLAVVKGKPNKHGVVKNYLAENKAFMVYATDDKRVGKIAVTEYDLIAKKGGHSLLKINIKTGRKNQIRVHMNDLKTPIVGDKKYAGDRARDMLLHAYLLTMIHPITNKEMTFTCRVPNYFYTYIDKENFM